MDPRFPEHVKPRMEELIQQYDKYVKSLDKAKTTHEVDDIERTTVLVVQEIQATASILQQDLISRTRTARQKLANTDTTPTTEQVKAEKDTETTPKPEQSEQKKDTDTKPKAKKAKK